MYINIINLNLIKNLKRILNVNIIKIQLLISEYLSAIDNKTLCLHLHVRQKKFFFFKKYRLIQYCI